MLHGVGEGSRSPPPESGLAAPRLRLEKEPT
jgi:hypothetical protein